MTANFNPNTIPDLTQLTEELSEHLNKLARELGKLGLDAEGLALLWEARAVLLRAEADMQSSAALSLINLNLANAWEAAAFELRVVLQRNSP